jgi:hypothetical protein
MALIRRKIYISFEIEIASHAALIHFSGLVPGTDYNNFQNLFQIKFSVLKNN